VLLLLMLMLMLMMLVMSGVGRPFTVFEMGDSSVN